MYCSICVMYIANAYHVIHDKAVWQKRWWQIKSHWICKRSWNGSGWNGSCSTNINFVPLRQLEFLRYTFRRNKYTTRPAIFPTSWNVWWPRWDLKIGDEKNSGGGRQRSNQSPSPQIEQRPADRHEVCHLAVLRRIHKIGSYAMA